MNVLTEAGVSKNLPVGSGGRVDVEASLGGETNVAKTTGGVLDLLVKLGVGEVLGGVQDGRQQVGGSEL